MANKFPVTPSSVRKQTKGPRSPSPLGKDSPPIPVPAEKGVLPLKTPAFDPRLLLTKLSAGRSRHEYLPGHGSVDIAPATTDLTIDSPAVGTKKVRILVPTGFEAQPEA